jgi:predicted oxidoreductase
MGLLDSVKGKAIDFLWGIAMKKGAVKAAQVLIAWVSSLPLEHYGVQVSFQEAAVVAAIAGLLEMGRNALKVKLGVKGI